MPTPKITIHLVSSLNGIIAKKDNTVDWFETKDHYENGITEENAAAFMTQIDCFVMGANTYKQALGFTKDFGWAYGDVPTIVLTHQNLPKELPTVEFYAGDLQEFVEQRLKPKYQNIWVVGGGELIKDFIRLKLAHEIRLSVLPIILGDGMVFLEQIGTDQTLHLKNVMAYKTGMVELWYEIIGSL